MLISLHIWRVEGFQRFGSQSILIDCHQILPLLLIEFGWIDKLLFPLKYQKTFGFLMVSRGIEINNSLKFT